MSAERYRPFRGGLPVDIEHDKDSGMWTFMCTETGTCGWGESRADAIADLEAALRDAYHCGALLEKGAANARAKQRGTATIIH